jgi:uncharacterized ferritin-like protein (DUF455 family)
MKNFSKRFGFLSSSSFSSHSTLISTSLKQSATLRSFSSFNLWKRSNEILLTSSPSEKVKSSLEISRIWFEADDTTKLTFLDPRQIDVPETPARPYEPICVPSTQMPSFRECGVTLVVYLLHSIAHIELNAIDMCWDLIARFRNEQQPLLFYSDFIKIASDEARHFASLSKRLEELGSRYGALLAHDSLWKNAVRTKSDLKGRIAVMQLVQEARALDSQERLVHRVGSGGDRVTMKLVETICKEEEDHVRKGMYWFLELCKKENVDPKVCFQELVKKYSTQPITPPFNHTSRERAGFTQDWYMPLTKTKYGQRT